MFVTLEVFHEDRGELKVEHPKNADAKEVLEEITGYDFIKTSNVLNWLPFLDKVMIPN